MAAEKTIVLITGSYAFCTSQSKNNQQAIGGNQGIDYFTAQALASTPDYHVIIGSRSLESGQQALSELQSPSLLSTTSLVQLDLTIPTSTTSAAAQVEKDFGRLDVLINNAGIIAKSPHLLDRLREQFETNTFGPAVVTEAFLPLLEKSRNARLVYVSSGLGSLEWRSDPGNMYHGLPATAYRMSKAALDMLAVCHHVEFKDKGIKVWAFDPEYVVTNLSETGEQGKKERIRNGAGDSNASAHGLKNIVEGKRDNDVGKHIDGN